VSCSVGVGSRFLVLGSLVLVGPGSRFAFSGCSCGRAGGAHCFWPPAVGLVLGPLGGFLCCHILQFKCTEMSGHVMNFLRIQPPEGIAVSVLASHHALGLGSALVHNVLLRNMMPPANKKISTGLTKE
jgi:hypothetical protein